MKFNYLEKEIEFPDDISEENKIYYHAGTFYEKKFLEYIRSLREIEDAIEPYAEQKRELKANFKEQGWLTGDEISLAVKAYRMLKKDQDIEDLAEMFNYLRGNTNADR